MKPQWVATLGCLFIFITAGHSAAVPTQDTMVVARSDDASTTPEAIVTEPTTEESLLPIKLTEMEVNSEVSLRYAHTAVVARVRNPAKRAQEAHFRVLLPETAFISGFVMTLDGKSYKAYVKEKEEAKQIYQQAVSQGISAAHVTAKARDSNQFVVTINVEPLSVAVFNLTYEELLVRRNGVYNHAINLHPGALVPKLTVTVHIKEAQKITELRVPEIRTGNEIDATKDDAQNSRVTIEKCHDDREAIVKFTPDLEEQRRLMQLYAEKSKESGSQNVQTSDENESSELKGVLGQFVIQYDVDRPKDGEILVNEGYFVHFFAPTSLPPLNKYVVFVLDTSGSMMDRKIVQLREAMQTILSDLNSGDYFSIVEFASTVTVHDLKEADGEPPKRHYYYNDYNRETKLVPPSQATPENIEKAKVIISRLDAAGGTNIASALDVAVNLIHKRVGWTEPQANTSTESVSTASTTAETEVSTTETTKTENGKEVQTEEDKEKIKTLEPIIIFLTDGDPTVGETNPGVIINRLTEKNYGEEKATIFSLAFGEDADRKFLRKLSLRNDGFMRHIYEAADAALQLRDFYRQVSSPLLADVKFVYPPNQVVDGSLTKHSFRSFYAGSEVVVAGHVADDVSELTPQVLGFCGVQDGHGRKRYEKLPKAPVPAKRQGYLPLERLWSYLTIKQLLDEKDAMEDDHDIGKDLKNTPEKKALALALKYEFVTPLTSLVVVKPNDSQSDAANSTQAVNAVSVDEQNSNYLTSGAPVSLNYGSMHRPLFSHSFSRPGSQHIYTSQMVGAPVLDDIQYEHAILAVDDYDYDAESLARKHYRVPQAQFIDRADSYQITSLNIAGPLMPSQQYQPSFIQNSGAGLAGLTGLTATFAPPFAVSTSAAPPRSLDTYHLTEYSWADALLDAAAEALVFQINGTNVELKLTRDSSAPKASGGDKECEKAADGNPGLCVYITRCDTAKNITEEIFKSTYCSVNEGYAGVCCNSMKVDLLTA